VHYKFYDDDDDDDDEHTPVRPVVLRPVYSDTTQLDVELS